MSGKHIHKKQNVLLVIGRDNIIKDRQLIYALRESFADLNYDFMFYGSRNGDTALFLREKVAYLESYPVFRKIYKCFVLLMYPSRWSYYVSWMEKEQAMEKQCKKLEACIQRLQQEYTSIVILSRSAGGRASSLIADKLGIQKLICMGYPFKHPEKADEPERYTHLKTLQAQFLILQGHYDEYGGLEINGKYPLSPSTTLEFVQTDHNFRLSEREYEHVIARIKDFIRM